MNDVADIFRLERVVTMLAKRIARAERAPYDPEIGLTLAERCDRIAELNDLWRMTEAVGLADRVRLRVQVNGDRLARAGAA